MASKRPAKRRRRNPVSDCPLTAALAAMSGKWKLIMIYWRDEPAFEAHARLPHTVEFLATVAPLLTHEVEVARLSPIA